MTISAWPLDAVNGAPTYSGRVLRQTTNAPVFAGASASRPLGAFSGVRPGTSSGTVTATATTWTVRPVAGVIDGEAAAEAGPYTFASDANVTGPIKAANSSNPRTDISYVQISDPAEADGSSAPAVTIGYLEGTPGPLAPVPATPARSFRLARINVPKAGGGDPSVTWDAPVSVAAGGVVPVLSADALFNLPGYPGAYADLSATTDTVSWPIGLYRSDGTKWAPVTGDTNWIPATLTAGTADATYPPRYRRIGSWVSLDGKVTPSSTSQTVYTLPAGFRPSATRNVWLDRNTSTQWAAQIRPTGAVIMVGPSGGSGPIDLAGFAPFPADL